MTNLDMKNDPLKPSMTLLCKLASVAVHADEMLSPNGHQFDHAALKSAMNDAEVVQWIKDMVALGMAPVKR